MRTIFNIKGALAALGFAALFLTGCDNRRLGIIEGQISGAKDQLLVLEHLTDGAPRLVDTLRLDSIGQFKFRPEVENGPDFFCLRLGNQSISLVIDTLLNPVEVSAEAANMFSSYKVKDALNQELQEAVQLGNRLRGQIANVNLAFNQGQLDRETSRDSILSLVHAYKKQVLDSYIYSNPASPASYYLLFETIQGLSIFDAKAAEDYRSFGAVATNWMVHYPASPRNKVLSKMTLEAQALRRNEAARAQRTDSLINQTPIEVRNFPELNLANADDRLVSLTETVDGSAPVLLDFTAYFMGYSPAHNMALAALYEKNPGLKIYQVCLDYDEHFWKTSADNVPWITVRDQSVLFDQQGLIQYSNAALLFNVSKLPTTFIINKAGELTTRVEADDEKLAEELKKSNK